jgi:hypothetical protein
MENGQLAIQPNNSIRFFDPSLNPRELKTLDFEVALNNHSVEQHAKWRLGDITSHSYNARIEETSQSVATSKRYFSKFYAIKNWYLKKQRGIFKRHYSGS